MQIPWLERYLQKSPRARLGIPRLAKLMSPNPVCDRQTGFIHHPSCFPIEFKRLWLAEWLTPVEDDPNGIGVMFESDVYLKPGANVEIRIPLRHEIEKFHGRVVLVRTLDDGRYEIGIWLPQRYDAARARIVEQICHIETYLLQKKLSDGPYAFNSDRTAEEWVRDNARDVPRL